MQNKGWHGLADATNMWHGRVTTGHAIAHAEEGEHMQEPRCAVINMLTREHAHTNNCE